MVPYRCRVVYFLYICFILSFANRSTANRSSKENSNWRLFRLKNASISDQAVTPLLETTTTSSLLTTIIITHTIQTTSKEANNNAIVAADANASLPEPSEKNENLTDVKRPVDNVEIKEPEQTVTPTQTPSFIDGIFDWLSSIFNKSSLILTIAFGVCLLLIVSIILLSICVYRSVCRRRRSKPPKITLTNPEYDKIPKNGVDFLDPPDSSSSRKKIYNGGDLEHKLESPHSKASSSETIRLLEMKTGDDDAGRNGENGDILNKTIQTLNSSSLSSSIDSVIENTPRTPKAQAQTPSSLNTSNIKSSITSLTKKKNASSKDLEKSLLLDDDGDDDDGSANTSVNKSRYTPSLKNKTKQQLSKEEQVSRRSLFINRTKSESIDEQPVSQRPPVPPQDKHSNRISIASSTSSIVHGNQSIDFSQMNTGLDEYLNNVKQVYESSSSINVNKDSVHNSLSDIYIQAIKEKREQEHSKKMQKNIAITESTIGISMNPGGNAQRKSVTNLNNNNLDAVSVHTYASEKSSY